MGGNCGLLLPVDKLCESKLRRTNRGMGSCLVKREISDLRAPVPRQNARRGLCQFTNRNQTQLSHGEGGSYGRLLWRSDEIVEELERG